MGYRKPAYNPNRQEFRPHRGVLPLPSVARLCQSVAVAASAIGLFCACGIGFHNNAPPSPPPLPALSTTLSLNTFGLSFDTRVIDTHSPPQKIFVTNSGLAPITLDSIGPYGPRQELSFDIDAKPCLTELAPGATCTITAIFHPRTIGNCYCRLFLHLPGHADTSVVLTGIGAARAESRPPSP
jgi:hypothetical protein